MAELNKQTGDKPVEQQAREQTTQRQVQMRVDKREMASAYANIFRTIPTAEEVVLDFGLNLPNPGAPQDKPEFIFKINQRVVLNYYSAKRLAIALSREIRRHEDQFGELELDVNKRQVHS